MGLIYGLVDPRTGDFGYIGQTKRNDVSKRYIEHLRLSQYLSSPKGLWIQSMLSNNTVPQIEVLEQVEDNSQLDKREVAWIEWARSEEYVLYNTDTPALKASKYGSKTQEVFDWLERNYKNNPENIPSAREIVHQFTLFGHSIYPSSAHDGRNRWIKENA